MKVDGIYPSTIPCSFCHKPVFDTDATWSEGLPYHDKCFKLYLANTLKNYNKKGRLGLLTLAEAKEMADIQETFDIVKKAPVRPLISKLINIDHPRFEGNTPLALASRHREALKASEEKLRLAEVIKQRLELLNEPVLLLNSNHKQHENEPSFPLENEKNVRTPAKPKKSPFLGILKYESKDTTIL